MIGLTSEITDKFLFGRREQHLHLCPQINQSNFYSANISGVARVSGADEASVVKCLIEKDHFDEQRPLIPRGFKHAVRGPFK